MRAKFTIDMDILEFIIPGSRALAYLPRKKKKKLKKEITNKLLKLALEKAESDINEKS